MKLYLAGPMRGVKDFNFPAFHAAAADLRTRGHEVFSPAEHDESEHGNTFQSITGDEAELNNGFNLRDALLVDLSWICQNAEGIALLTGWEASRGAQAELATAAALGLKVIKQTEYGWKSRMPRTRKKKNGASE